MIRRARIIVSGTVQEAGYREEVAEKAFDLRLRGLVRNLEDGTVEVLCEGEESAIRALARKINFRKYPVEVESVRCRCSEPTGEFRKFSIIKDSRLDSDLSSKLETGFRFIKHMHRDLAGTKNGVGSEVRKAGSAVRRVGSDVRRVGGDVRAMNRDTGRRFDRLDRSYGSFGRTLRTVSRDMKGLKRPMESMNRSSRAMAADVRSLRKAAAPSRPRRKTRAPVTA